MSSPIPPPVPLDVEEVGRRIRWPALPALIFLGIMIVLAIVAVSTLRSDPPIVRGLPDDPDVREASAILRGRVRMRGDLAFESALLGVGSSAPAGVSPAEPLGPFALEPLAPADTLRIETARARLELARSRLRHDPRLGAALASLHLLRGDLRRAEHAYWPIVDGKPGYGEARLGLGVTLAMRAEATQDPNEARRLELQAIAQFAAVRADDPAAEAARANRILLLRRVGRDAEAHTLETARAS